MVSYKPTPHKEQIRELVYNYFVENKCTSTLTLPNLYFSLESKLIEKGIKVDCIERDLEVFKKQLEIVPKGVNLYKSTLGKFDTTSYDGLFLDLCGCFSSDLHSVLQKIVSKSSIVITLRKGRENKSLMKHLDISNRQDSYIKLLKRYNVKTNYYTEYISKVPMIVFFCTKL